MIVLSDIAVLESNALNRSTEDVNQGMHPARPGDLGFAIWLASRDGYDDSLLSTGFPAGSPEEAVDCACGLRLDDPTAWLQALKD